MSLLAGIGQTIINGITSSYDYKDKVAGLEYAWNQKAADAAQKRALEYWNNSFNRTNVYNTPSAVLSRYREAGLGRAALLGGELGVGVSDGGDVASPGSSFKPSLQNGVGDIFGPIIQARMAEAQIKALNSRSNLDDVKAGTEETIQILNRNRAMLAEIQSSTESFRAESFRLDNELKSLTLDTNVKITQAQYENILAQGQKYLEEARRLKDGNDAKIGYHMAMNYAAQTALIKSRDLLTQQEVLNAQAMFEKITAEGTIQKIIAAGYALADEEGRNGSNYIHDKLAGEAAQGRSSQSLVDFDFSKMSTDDFGGMVKSLLQFIVAIFKN